MLINVLLLLFGYRPRFIHLYSAKPFLFLIFNKAPPNRVISYGVKRSLHSLSLDDCGKSLDTNFRFPSRTSLQFFTVNFVRFAVLFPRLSTYIRRIMKGMCIALFSFLILCFAFLLPYNSFGYQMTTS